MNNEKPKKRKTAKGRPSLIRQASADDPIYSEPPSIRFVNRQPAKTQKQSPTKNTSTKQKSKP